MSYLGVRTWDEVEPYYDEEMVDAKRIREVENPDAFELDEEGDRTGNYLEGVDKTIQEEFTERVLEKVPKNRDVTKQEVWVEHDLHVVEKVEAAEQGERGTIEYYEIEMLEDGSPILTAR